MIYFEKRESAPQSLALEKAKGTDNYRGSDVLKALSEDFKNKCYLCETKCPVSINIEHFEEHRGDRDKMFDWKNLFYACAHCNQTKNDNSRKTSSNILNCTSKDHLVDYWIEYRLAAKETFDKLQIEIKRNDLVPPTKCETEINNTVQLLDKIYNGTGTPIKNQEAYNLALQVNKEMTDFAILLEGYCFADSQSSKDSAKNKIAESLNENMPYIAFKKWKIRDLKLEKDFPV